MDVSNDGLFSSINIKDIYTKYESEEQLMEDYSENASKLISLFEIVVGKNNQEFVKGTDLVNKIFKQIKVLDLEKRLELSQIEQIIDLSSRIYPSSSEYFDFCAAHLSMGNVFTYLKNAQNVGSEADIKKCLDYISHEMGVKIEVKEDHSLTIEISDPKTPWNEFSKGIANLSKIYNGQLALSFSPSYSEKIPDIIQFIEVHGILITLLDLKELENQIDDNFIEKSIKSCPNICHLAIRSNKIEGKGLEEVSSIKNLTSLDLRRCTGLKHLPVTWPSGLTSLVLMRCTDMKEIPELPSGLTLLDLSECSGLKELPELPSGLTSLVLTRCSDLQELPAAWPSGLTSLVLTGCSDLQELPAAWSSGLTSLVLTGCSDLQELPAAWPSGLTTINLNTCTSLKELPAAWPSGLTTINLRRCTALSEDDRFAALSLFLDQNFVQGLKLAIGFCISDKVKLRSVLLPKLEQKMGSPTTSPDDLPVLAEFIHSYALILGLHDEHPLIQEAINIVAINEQPGLKNPFRLFKKLKDLFQVASNFTPEKMDVAGMDVGVNMDQLKAMSDALNIKRVDLQEMVTLESFDKLFNDLKIKVDTGEGAANEALIALGTSFAEVQMPISGDPSQYLKGLLNLSGENVSEVEAKWRAVLWNILEKDHAKKDDHFFTEREEVFIKTMMGIQNCEGGKVAGIASSYEQLDSKYRYQVKLSKPMSVMEAETEDKKLKGIAFVKEFLKSLPSDGSTADIAEKLAAFVNADLRDRSVNITPWLEDESFWDEDNYELNKAGSSELLKIAKREEAKTLFSHVIGETVQKLVASQFSGTNPLMEELVGIKGISQGSHHSIYLKNLIGHLVGVSQAVAFDRSTGVLHENLINKSRDEVLETFFKYVTPEVMVNDVVRSLNEPSVEALDALKSFLPEDKFWDNTEKGTLSKLGALELLVTLNYVA